MHSKDLAVTLNTCGRECQEGVCDQPAVVWALVEGKDWENAQIAACHEHRNEVYDHPSVYLTSDAIIMQGDA